MAAGIAVGSLSMHKCGSEKKIELQSPSLLGPDAVQFEGLYGAALDIDDTGMVPMSYNNANFNIDKFTIVADTSYTDIAAEYGKNPGDPVTYDGGTYWIVRDTVLIAAKDENSNQDGEDGSEDEVIYLSLADSVTRISYTSEWSLIKLADGKAAKIIVPSDVVDTATKNVLFSELTEIGNHTEAAAPEPAEPIPDPCCERFESEPELK